MPPQPEKLRVEAEDCALINKLAGNPRKRELFEKIAAHLNVLASEVERAIAESAREARHKQGLRRPLLRVARRAQQPKWDPSVPG